MKSLEADQQNKPHSFCSRGSNLKTLLYGYRQSLAELPIPSYDKRSQASPLYLKNNAVECSRTIQSNDYMETILVRTSSTHQPVSMESLPNAVS